MSGAITLSPEVLLIAYRVEKETYLKNMFVNKSKINLTLERQKTQQQDEQGRLGNPTWLWHGKYFSHENDKSEKEPHRQQQQQ